MNITEAFKTDIAHVGDLVRSASGGIGTISGLTNLKAALWHRLLTVPGTLVHRPTYGVGIMTYQNAPTSYSVQRKLASIIQEQFSNDERVEEVSSVRIVSDDSTPEQTVLSIFIKPVGYSEIEMTFSPFNGET
jgi:phage baseplate assembly protein W